MSPPRALAWRSRADFRGAAGVLLVLRPPPPAVPPSPGQPPTVPANPAEGDEILLALADDGHALALQGHVDLGTGLRTALGQIAADELDLPFDHVHVVLGDTGRAPNQGPTIASSSIQIHAQPLRLAAAQARAWLVQRAASHWGLADASNLHTQAGHVLAPDGRALAYADLVAGRHVELMLDAATPVKPVGQHRLVGQSVPRVDLPAKVAAEAVYVHDVRLPGMLHGRVVRPPYAGLDAGDFVGHCLRGVDESSIAHLSGIERVVVVGDFIGIVAQREDVAEAAMRALKVDWAPFTPVAPLDDLAAALSAHPSTPRVVADSGGVDAALQGVAQRLDRDYVWPYQLHASIGPSCAVADWHADGTSAAASGAQDGRSPQASDGSAPDAGPSGPAAPGPRATVWAGTQNPHVLRADLAKLTGLADTAIDMVRLEASGCYGRNGADDVAADALLLARAVGRPVRVQLTREQEHAWEPKGAAQLMQVRGGLAADGAPLAYDFNTCYPSNGAPTLALLLTGAVPAVRQAFAMGDRTAVPPYAYAQQRITVNDMAPILRASWLRGVSALPNSFAHESYIDELAHAAGADPVAYRLQHLPDDRAAQLLRATADKAGWRPHTQPMGQPPRGDWLPGQGVAYARYIHSKFPGFGAAWAAWVADVQVNQVTGEVHVARVVVGHDAGLMVNPKGVEQQVHGNVLQTTSRALKEQVTVDPQTRTVTNRDWGSYPILSFREVPVVEVLLMPRPGEPPLGAGESASVPGTAAIANAIFDATGVRLRQPPFTPEVVRAAMAAQGAGAGGVAEPDSTSERPALGMSADRRAAADAGPATANDHHQVHGALAPSADLAVGPAAARQADAVSQSDPQRRRKPGWAVAGGVAAGLLAAGAALLGWRPAIAPVVASTAGVYSPALIERGRQLAAIGNCMACHTADGGLPNAGGRPLHTPFGTVWSTNLTPHPVHGIGQWSFSAFQRAMREGVSRDGHRLYPAFPYTAFTQASDDELQALYAYLMSQPALDNPVPETRLAFPFNLRPLLGLWNALYLQTGPVATLAPAATTQNTVTASASAAAEVITAPPSTSPLWQRGAQLVNGLGHCGACHTPRDALGAERSRDAYLAGAVVDGWEAPPLGRLARGPVPWTEAAMLQYLRQGHHPHHGIAGGPMAPVVQALAQAPEDDLRAMAHYLVALQDPPAPARDDLAATLVARAAQQSTLLPGPAQRLFEGACGACHHDGEGPAVLGLNQPLALNSTLHSARPDNLLRTVLDGIQRPAFVAIGHMPGFRHALDDRQLADLAAWMRQRFAPGQPPWADLPAAVTRVRAATL